MLITFGFIFLLNSSSSLQIIPVDASRACNSSSWTFSKCALVENNTLVSTVTKGAYAQAYFYGTGVELFVRRDPLTGSADVYIDDRYAARIDTLNTGVLPSTLIFTTNGLRRAGHTIQKTAALAGCSESQVKRIWAMH